MPPGHGSGGRGADAGECTEDATRALAVGISVTAPLAEGAETALERDSLRQPPSAANSASTPSAGEIACPPNERCERRGGTSAEADTEATRMAKPALARHPRLGVR